MSLGEYKVGAVSGAINEQANSGPKQFSQQGSTVNNIFAISNRGKKVEHVPLKTESQEKQTTKRKKIKDFNIVKVNKAKKVKLNKLEKSVVDGSEELETILQAEDNDSDVDVSNIEALRKNDVSATLKKIEIQNIKKNELNKNTPKEDDNRVIHVKNLPVKIKRKAIKYLFAKFGQIQSVWLRCAPLPDPAIPKKIAIIKQDFHPERQSISAFVRFVTEEAAKSALSLSGTIFQDHHLSVSLAASPANKKELSKGIFVGNLPFGIEDEKLWEHFSECGSIMDVRIIRDKSTGMGKGFGYVNFGSSDGVELALKLNGSTLEGREIRVQRCKENPKKRTAEKEKKTNSGGAARRLKENEQKKKSGRKTTIRHPSKKKIAASIPSFAGETVTEGSKKPLDRLTKKGKKNTQENRKKIIAAKLSSA